MSFDPAFDAGGEPVAPPFNLEVILRGDESARSCSPGRNVSAIPPDPNLTLTFRVIDDASVVLQSE